MKNIRLSRSTCVQRTYINSSSYYLLTHDKNKFYCRMSPIQRALSKTNEKKDKPDILSYSVFNYIFFRDCSMKEIAKRQQKERERANKSRQQQAGERVYHQK